MFVRKGVVLLIALTACAGLSGRGSRPSREPLTTIEVDNNSFPDVVLYAVNGGAAVRLGTVNGHSTQTFTLSGLLVSRGGLLQLVARPIAGVAYSLPAVAVSVGDHVALTIGNTPAYSSISVVPPPR